MSEKQFVGTSSSDAAFQTHRKKIIFIGGAKGVGKHDMAIKIQNSYKNTIIIKKNEITTVLRETLMEMYNKKLDNTVSPEYLHKVEPLEYKQLIKTIEHITDYNNCNIIVEAEFFNQFAETSWLKTIRTFYKFKEYDFEFIFLYKDSKKIPYSKCRRVNTRLREKINIRIDTIKKSAFIKKHSTDEVFTIANKQKIFG